MSVYITDLACFLPNDPISNEEMERMLGMVNDLPSRTRRIVLRNNGIKTRFYAIDPSSGEATHNNAQLAAEAVRRLHPYPGFALADLECLCCGTSIPDQIMPGHALMVQGELAGAPPLEAVSTAGVCLSGITALKYAWMAVACGEHRNAVATGSELASSSMSARQMERVSATKAEALHENPALSFDEDFLRWMLSDGAGAAFLTADPPTGDRLVLRIDWIETVSFAHMMDTCMYAGARKMADGRLQGWRQFERSEALATGVFNIKQDVRLLNEQIIRVTVDLALPGIMRKRALKPEQVDWFLPHYSSNYFRLPLQQGLERVGMNIPGARWFTNLTSKGNTGSASFYIILEELFKSGRLKRGEKLLCFIPESGRFSTGYLHLTVC